MLLHVLHLTWFFNVLDFLMCLVCLMIVFGLFWIDFSTIVLQKEMYLFFVHMHVHMYNSEIPLNMLTRVPWSHISIWLAYFLYGVLLEIVLDISILVIQWAESKSCKAGMSL